MVGFMHFAESPRHIDVETIGGLIAKLSGTTKSVVVLVDPDDALVKTIAGLKPDFIQLHGTETANRVQAIRKMSGLSVMKAVAIGDKEDLAMIDIYQNVADLVLLDAKAPKDATRPGGLGKTFDWSLLAGLEAKIGFVLSGGLNRDNVGEAISLVHPFGVDVSSGVESAPGIKDKAMIKTFIKRARDASRMEDLS